ncbi:MAG: 50S ribosomal protein L10 [Candidatus Shapirobacteria bacterium]|jgi:large subunit ribosomal protein L10
MPNQQKINQVEDLAKKLESAKSAALVQYQGLNAAGIAALRDQVKQKGGVMEVAKNTLIIRALIKFGINLPAPLTGPTSIAFCNTDEIAPLKEIEKVNKEKELTQFKYGIYDKKLLTVDELKKLLTLPSKSALMSNLVGSLINPLQRLVYALRFNQTQFVMTLKAISEKNKPSPTLP